MKQTFIITGGKIFTSDEEGLYADSMIVEDGVITWIGAEAELPVKDYPSIDLAGKRVLPGFVDAHMHSVILADFSRQISCLPPKVHSIEEMVSEISRARRKQGPDQWIQGWGYDEGKLAEKRSPNRYDLDRGCADAPVCILRTCAHIRCVNSKALELAGIDKNTPDPQGGQIDRDENGEPTGILRENARDLVMGVMPELTRQQIVEELVELGQLLASQGITAIGDMGNLEPGDHFDKYLEAAEKGFRQRAAIYYMWDHFVDNKEFDIPASHFAKNRQIRAAGLKLIGDGSVSGRTAWMNKPYLGTGDEYGMPVCSDELMESAIAFCKKKRCQLSMHAMGAKAIERIVGRVYGEPKWTDGNEPHLRVEHVTDPTEEAMDQAIEKGIAFVTQPIFLYAEIESYLTNLGEDWMKQTYPIKHMLDKGVKLCFSTDAPATSWAVPSDPFPCIKGAVTRIAYDGTDCGQQQKVDVETAIKLYTRESAQAAGFERIGQLKPGYYADFIVLDQDIFSIPPEDIDKITVEQTYIAGEKIYQK